MTNRDILRHYLGSAKASVWQVDLEEQGLPGVRTTTSRDIETLLKAFKKEGCERGDRRNFAFAVISMQLWTDVLDRSGIHVHATRDPCHEIPYLDFASTERFVCMQGRTRVHAARRLIGRDEQWWPFDFYRDGDKSFS
jgi:hypothetical protein